METKLYRVCKVAIFVLPLLILATLIIGLYFHLLSIDTILIIEACSTILLTMSIFVLVHDYQIRKVCLDKFLPKLL